MDGIHSNMVPNGELKLYLKSIKDLLKLSVSKSELKKKYNTPKSNYRLNSNSK